MIEIPLITNSFFCIINRNDHLLAATISSYLVTPNIYLPMFEYPSVTAPNYEGPSDGVDEHSISRTRSMEFNIKIKNTINRIGGCENLILGNLSEDQKSYLTFLNDYNVIEINSHEDVETFLFPFVSKNGFVLCREEDHLKGLFNAVNSNAVLKIDSTAPLLEVEQLSSEGIIIIEDDKKVSSVVAVNYAISVNAIIRTVEPPRINHREISNLIEQWQNGDVDAYNNLSAEFYGKVDDIRFSDYKYATFFTLGGPYSLVIKNAIPCTHVHLHFSPDFFIFNNLYFENNEKSNASIVFSPLEFKDEETSFVIDKLKEANLYVKELVGKEASVYNLDMHVKEFPFNLLHICSHGGEVDGYFIAEEFTDSAGNIHKVEYDEVVSFAPSHLEEKIAVTSKMLFRKFDDLNWKSKELKAVNYPHHVFSDMINELRKKDHKHRIRKENIPNSSAIKCHDFNYQAMFNLLAGSHSPVVFNNTCWSWSDIADSFLAVGSRCYIGTLWAVENHTAKVVAEKFYENLFAGSILEAFTKSIAYCASTKNDNIYIMWGLHFSTLNRGSSVAESKKEVAVKMLQSIARWKDKLLETSKDSSIETIEAIIRWSSNEINTNYRAETLQFIREQKPKS